MARLTGPEDHILELEAVSYQFPPESTASIPPIEDDLDANWLLVRIEATDGERTWSTTDPAFLNWELFELADWLRSLAHNAPGVPQAFTGIEPILQFKAREAGNSTRLTASFVFGPHDAPDHDRFGKVEFTPGIDGLMKFAGELEEELRSFPIRVIEADGPAKRHLKPSAR